MYFNNAATTWPKPEVVYETLDRTFRSLNSPERTTSDEGARSNEMMSSCREELAAFFNIKDPRRLIFTPSATYSLNLAILGLDWRDGDVMLMSGLEHHAVSRPIRKVAREHGARFEVAPYSPQQPIDLNFVEDKLKAGNVKLLAFAGHKGLFGPPGGGGLFVRKGIQLETLAEGGTGKDSGKHEMSGRYPSNYEVGTHNLLSIVGMTAGVRWIKEQGQEALRQHELNITRRFSEGAAKLPGVTLYGHPDVERRTAVVSLTMDGVTPEGIAQWLAEEHNVSTRAGYHCAPLPHETIGTLPGDGTIRFSFGFSNTAEEIDQVLGYLAEVPRLEGQLDWVV